ncbi:hypothetical protein [Couchioplanes caeruleus]|uniref:Uncharacterized protein n=2 Tax=Couchioplanes caeruleus TaxID=56438 RepID=A0A1K0FGS1_9ACTN|nr:hypothetical protein [Couchioplanes caeruleus]OJF12033.1 hypothetical protein BG844_22850 [Couchioplanes caeruleus subsp. caeruleus]ROP29853.1 hypothetical protein EDD30_2674 [Couchioplanes caeruleus]
MSGQMRWPRRRSGDSAIIRHTVGNAVVLRARSRISPEARDIALAVQEDAHNDIVLLDLHGEVPMGLWESVAAELRRRRRGIRLVVCGQRQETAALAGQWLSDRLHRTVIAPYGHLYQGVAGSLFVHATDGGGWVRHRPGKPPALEAKRFPQPEWDLAVATPRPTSSVGVAEPLPGGVWIHDTEDSPTVQRHWRWLASAVPCQPQALSIVLGCPGTAPLSLDDVARFWRELDDEGRRYARFIQFGPVALPKGDALGQALADTLRSRVVCFGGIPVGEPERPDMYTVESTGSLGWQVFARELAYEPRARPTATAATPQVLSHQAPPLLGEPVGPMVYWYAPDAVVEVVQAGLWMRPAVEPRTADSVRAVKARPDRNTFVFDDSTEHLAQRMRELAEDAIARLDPATRQRSVLCAASEVAAGAQVSTTADSTLADDPIEVAHAATVAALEEATGAMPALAGSPPPATSIAVPLASNVIDAPVREIAAAPEPAVAAPVPSTPPEPSAPPAPPVQPATAPATAVAVPSPSASVPKPVASPVPAASVPSESAPPSAPASPSAPAPATAPATATAPPTAPASPSVPVRKAPASRTVPVARAQPTPAASASAAPSGRPIDEERAWMRRSLSREFDIVASSIARVLSQHPGLQGGPGRATDEIVNDSVAVRLYLSAKGTAIDTGLRSGAKGPHVPFARCVVAGLSLLPSHRGTAVFSASPSPEQWDLLRRRRLVTEWGFTAALTAPSADQTGDADVLLWSMTARRTRLLEPDGEDRADDRVLFTPGTSFKVLDLVEPGRNGDRGQILLRELAANEIDADGRVATDRASLDELAAASLRRCAERWAASEPGSRVGPSAVLRFGALPGLL